MLLKEILELNGLNRNSFNTLDRRVGLAFLKRGLVEGSARDRFTLTHAVALAAVLRLQQAGLDAKRAAAAVDENYRVLIDWVAYLTLHPEQRAGDGWWLTVINFADGGWGWATGNENADTFGGGVAISKVSINIGAVVEELWSRRGDRFRTADGAAPQAAQA
jgi:hypothetical protein